MTTQGNLLTKHRVPWPIEIDIVCENVSCDVGLSGKSISQPLINTKVSRFRGVFHLITWTRPDNETPMYYGCDELMFYDLT